jgi:hypothetical protein
VSSRRDGNGPVADALIDSANCGDRIVELAQLLLGTPKPEMCRRKIRTHLKHELQLLRRFGVPND